MGIRFCALRRSLAVARVAGGAGGRNQEDFVWDDAHDRMLPLPRSPLAAIDAESARLMSALSFGRPRTSAADAAIMPLPMRTEELLGVPTGMRGLRCCRKVEMCTRGGLPSMVGSGTRTRSRACRRRWSSSCADGSRYVSTLALVCSNNMSGHFPVLRRACGLTYARHGTRPLQRAKCPFASLRSGALRVALSACLRAERMPRR